MERKTMDTRRQAIKLAIAGSIGLPVVARAASRQSAETGGAASQETSCNQTVPRWARGIEGQRKADLGDGRYLNPILAGDYPDPSVLKDGDDYYMTHSSFDSSPGLLIWHSRDLVNWRPIGPALLKSLGVGFAVDIAKHDGRYFIYIPFIATPWSKGLKTPLSIHVIHAPAMAGPWSDPVDLGISGLIDPGHVVGEDGHRYLFFNDGKRVRLSPDGLSTAGPVEAAYEAWHYPDDWITEAFSPEGPKLFRRGDYFYLVNAVGGTGGPATGHMIVAARSRSINGPWENCPHNPIQRTRSAAERWWSRGHATCIEGPSGRWYMVYHGFENGYRSLGRQTLLEPIEWGADGWFRATGSDLSMPLPMPGGKSVPHGMARSDDFTASALGTRWSLYASAPEEAGRVRIGNGALVLDGKGTGPRDCSPLTQQVGERAYDFSVEVELIGDAQGGLLLFFDDRLFLGMGIDGKRMTSYRGGKAAYWQEPAPAVRRLYLRIVNDHQIVTMYYSQNGADWTRHAVRSEVSGYNANTMDNLLSLRPAVFATGTGKVAFRNFRFKALP